MVVLPAIDAETSVLLESPGYVLLIATIKLTAVPLFMGFLGVKLTDTIPVALTKALAMVLEQVAAPSVMVTVVGLVEVTTEVSG